jgi:hypothetical protein
LTISAASLSFGRCDSEHLDDAVVDVDIYGHISCYGEFGIDYGGGLYPSRRYFTGHAEPNAVDDPAGAVWSDRDWGSNRTSFNQQQFVDWEHSCRSSEWNGHNCGKSSVDGERSEPELR